MRHPACARHPRRQEWWVRSSFPQLAPGRSVASYSTTGAVGVSHSQTTGVRAGLPVTGTYNVNPDFTEGWRSRRTPPEEV